MTFIVTLVALLIERFFDWGHLRNWSWYNAYQQMLVKKISGMSSYILLAVTVIPILIIVAIISAALSGILYGFLKLLFDIIVLLYCLGPQNLWANAFAWINTTGKGEKTSGPTETHFLKDIFIESNRRVFAVVFWYLILGPVGAVLYRIIASAAPGIDTQETNSDVAPSALVVENALDWLPVRLLTFIFALGGHFAKVINIWRHKVVLGLDANESMLAECGMAALGDDAGKVSENGAMEKEALGLIDRSFVIFLVIIAIITLFR